MKSGRVFLLAALWLPTVGCSSQDPLPVALPSDREAPDETLFSPSDLHAGLTWAESKVLAAPRGATRIGMLVDLTVPEQAVGLSGHLQVRGFDPSGQPTAWMPAEVTWTEENYLVARAETPAMIYAAQLRLPTELLPDIAHVTFAAIIPEVEATQNDSPEGLATAESALTVSQVIKPRSAWKARKTKCSTLDQAKYRMAIHHTYTAPKSGGSYAARIRSIQAYHMDTRGWCDVGYHFLVTDDGTVWEGRPMKYLGAHVGGNNTGNAGISFVGCFQTGECGSIGTMIPSDEALAAGGRIIAALSDQWSIKKDRDHIKGHREHSGASTACPGDLLFAKLSTLITLATDGADSTTPPTTSPSGGAQDGDPTAGTGHVMGVVWDASITSGPSDPGHVRIASAAVSAVGGPQVQVSGASAYWELSLAPGTWTLAASAPGYGTQTQTVTVTAGGQEWASLGLSPAPKPGDMTPAPASLRIKNKAGEPLADSIVYVTGRGYLPTNSQGELTVDLKEGPTEVRAWAAQHIAKTMSLENGEVADLLLSAEVSGAGEVQGVVWDHSATDGPTDTGNQRLPGTFLLTTAGRARVARAGDAYWSLSLPVGETIIRAVLDDYDISEQSVSVAAGSTQWGSVGLYPQGTSPAPTEPPPVTPPAPATVCYPGPAMTWDVCFPLVSKAEVADAAYDHPAGAPNSAQYASPTHFLDLESAPGSTKLAANFTLAEFMQTWKGHYGVYSPATVVHWQNIRESLGVALSVNSGYRSPGHNATISGSATFSRHTYGDAADVTANGAVSLSTLKKACSQEGADYVSVYTSHVHCDWRQDPLNAGFYGGGAGKPGAHGSATGQDSEGMPAAEGVMVEPANWTPAVGDAVILHAQWTGFDEGTPWIRWEVTGPDTALVLEPSVDLAFEAREAGDYTIRWDVAGRLRGSLVIHAQ